MKVLDRYVIASFCKVFAICLITLTGLFVVVDAFTNLEEFVEIGGSTSGIMSVVRAYYGPRTLTIFDQSCALLILAAAIGTLVWMQRANEVAAMEAAGVCKSRIVRPVICCAVAVIGLSIGNRELLIPRFRHALARNVQNWNGSRPRPITPIQDQVTGTWLTAGSVTLGAGEIAQPEFQLPAFGNDDRGLLTAELAASRTACAAHPAGFLLSGVKQPIDAGKPSWESAARSFILTPQDNAWLNSDELFLVSGVSLIDAAFGAELRRFASLGQQIRDLNNPALWTSNRQRVELHARIVRPVLDLTVALIGIPLVFSRRDRNVFLALGMCLVVVLAIQVLVVVSHGLGASRLIPSSSLAAWLPLFGLLPVGIAAQVQLEV